MLGTWRGAGTGHYPTIDDFAYIEEVTFGHVGKPFLSYGQKTRHADTKLPLHAESGFLRPVELGRVEFVVSQPSGIVEVHTGSVEAGDGVLKLSLRSSHVITTPTAKDATEVTRSLTVDGDSMFYELHMAAVGLRLQHHLSATLHRVGSGTA